MNSEYNNFVEPPKGGLYPNYLSFEQVPEVSGPVSYMGNFLNYEEQRTWVIDRIRSISRDRILYKRWIESLQAGQKIFIEASASLENGDVDSAREDILTYFQELMISYPKIEERPFLGLEEMHEFLTNPGFMPILVVVRL